MKKTYYYYLILLVGFISSCSSDDSGSSSSTPTTYLPLTNENYWTYDIENDNAGTISTSKDSLYVNGDILFSGITYKKMETENLPNGFYSSTLRNNGLRVDGKSVKLSGIASYDLGLGSPINLEINDFVILKENGSTNEQLSTKNGNFSQTISGYDLDFTYVLKSYNVSELATFTSPNGDIYTEVIKSKVVLNLKITTTQELVAGLPPVTITILAPQDVLTSYQYYAKNIGMFYTDTNITYELESIPGVTLPIPSTGSQSQEEFLNTYLVN